jgi:dipeptidyl aminopeptidase/acylaminoacyl peptidase
VARSRGLSDSSAVPDYRVFRWIAADGETRDAKLFLPRHRDSRSLSPLVIVPYGGFINNFPDADELLDGLLLELGRRGWAVALPNTRGAASDDSHIGHYGDVQLEDTDRLIGALGAARLADTTRVAVIGHSHGAALAYYYLTHSSRFCAVVAINGRADWELQARYGDAYLINQMGGTPDSLPYRYARFSPIQNAASVTTPLLAVSGAHDTQILPLNAARMVDSLHAFRKQAELLAFPDEGHILSKPDDVWRFREAVFALLGKSCGRF